jgi:Replication protein.
MVTASRAAKRRRQRQNADALKEYGAADLARRFDRCASENERRQKGEFSTWRCQHRHCEFCARIYSQKTIWKYEPKLARLVLVGYRLCLLTLTIRNSFAINLRQLEWLFMNYRKLQRRHPFKGRVIGSIARIEVDYNPDTQEFHVHIHAILVYQQCVPQEEIKAAWFHLTKQEADYIELKDSPSQADIPRSVWIDKIEAENENAFGEDLAIRNALGYVSKFRPFSDSEAFAQYECTARGFRLIRAYGALYGNNIRHYLD